MLFTYERDTKSRIKYLRTKVKTCIKQFKELYHIFISMRNSNSRLLRSVKSFSNCSQYMHFIQKIQYIW